MELKGFDKSKNYIGNKSWQYPITSPIAKLFSEINYSAYLHDILSIYIWAQKNAILRLILILIFDIVFLIVGLFRLVTHPKQILGVIVHIKLWVILTLAIPIRLWWNRKLIFDVTHGTYITKKQYKINKRVF